MAKDGRFRILTLIAKSVASTELPPKVMASLQTGADELFDLGDEFRHVPRFRNGSFHIYSYFEGRTTAGLGCRV